jgi:arylsulfatase A-like enzyme/Flp pilus assembly protein TadD
VVLALLLAAAAAAPPNLLLVTIDTLRADHVGAYGYAAGDTPALDRLAREGVLLEDATVQVPETRPSHACILTGRYPFEHGIRDNYSPPLKPGLPTLASVLRDRGYDTAAFVGAYPVAAVSGLDHGFAVYDDPFGSLSTTTTDDMRVERPAAEVAAAVLAYLKRPRTRPFFVWAHFFDPHYPYEPPPPYDRKFVKRPYDGEVAYADAQLGRLLSALDAAGLRSGTLVVVTSDHGEGLGDHGEDEHVLFAYDSTLRVPLVLSWPGGLPSGTRIAGQFRSVDLLPTTLALLGVPAPAVSGLSRAEAMRRGTRLPDNESYVEALFGHLRHGYAPLRALRAEGYKLIDLPKPELYRLPDDPGETRNLVAERSVVAARMRERLRAYDATGGAAPPAATPPIDPAARERLAALGYVDGGGPQGGRAGGADPKDTLQEFQRYRRDMFEAMRLYRSGAIDEALPRLERLARSDTASYNVQYFLGRSLLKKGRFAEAADALEKAVAMAPDAAPAHVYLARAYGEAGRLDRAEQALSRATKLEPRNVEFQREWATLLIQKGDVAGARAAVDRALAARPKDGRSRALLSACLRLTGDFPRALAEARQATTLEPKAAEPWIALGLALGASGDEADAAGAFRTALERAPDDPDALFYLGAIDLRAGRAKEALVRLEALSRRAPRYPGLEEVLALAREQGGPPPEGFVRLRLIRVADRAGADDVARRLGAGEDFATVARAASIDPSAALGGSLGNVRPEDLAEPLRAAAAGLAAGGRSGPIETASGYVILEREP